MWLKIDRHTNSTPVKASAEEFWSDEEGYEWDSENSENSENSGNSGNSGKFDDFWSEHSDSEVSGSGSDFPENKELTASSEFHPIFSLVEERKVKVLAVIAWNLIPKKKKLLNYSFEMFFFFKCFVANVNLTDMDFFSEPNTTSTGDPSIMDLISGESTIVHVQVNLCFLFCLCFLFWVCNVTAKSVWVFLLLLI